MVKAYLRYSEEASWGVVVSGSGHVAVDTTGRLAISPALESVIVWNIKQGSQVKRLQPADSTSEVTALELASDGDTLAVGHADGSIRIWSIADATERVKLGGHSSAVSTLRFSKSGTTLLSGSLDTNVILWDVIAETGLCRLRGHRGAVTDVCHLEGRGAIASVGKDGMLKLWDLHTQHCVQTAAAPSNELWSVDADEACDRLLTGGAGAEVLVWRLDERTLADRRPEAGSAGALGGPEDSVEEGVQEAWNAVHAVLLGPLEIRTSSARVARLRFGLGDIAVAVQFADRNLQLFSVQTAAQLKRQSKRRQAKKRRAAEGEDGGAADKDADGGGDEEAARLQEAADAFQPLTHVRGPHKLHSFAWAGGRTEETEDGEGAQAKTVRLLIADRSNSLKVCRWVEELRSVHIPPSPSRPSHHPSPSLPLTFSVPCPCLAHTLSLVLVLAHAHAYS